jgi:hypothetical protein
MPKISTGIHSNKAHRAILTEVIDILDRRGSFDADGFREFLGDRVFLVPGDDLNPQLARILAKGAADEFERWRVGRLQ